uniref:Uncharacterized protein n=1 Tax=Schistocephalus solidus TaxID=70667 RepID=A0A0V0J839_SCHSO
MPDSQTASNGLLEYFHCLLKASLRAYGKSTHWSKQLFLDCSVYAPRSNPTWSASVPNLFTADIFRSVLLIRSKDFAKQGLSAEPYIYTLQQVKNPLTLTRLRVRLYLLAQVVCVGQYYALRWTI